MMAAAQQGSEIWDRVWSSSPERAEQRRKLAVEEQSIRWQRIEARVRSSLGGFDGLRVIEIGAGEGTNAALMAARGASVTLLDYSDRALERARGFFADNELEAQLVKGNALELPERLSSAFDVAMSFGLNEHFTGPERLEIFASHLQALRAGGIALISVPNARNAPYRASKWLAEATGQWKLGTEVPFSRSELESICSRLGVGEWELFGDSVVTSLRFVNPWSYLRPRLPGKQRVSRRPPRRQRGTRLDERWSYATVLMMRKPG